MPTPKPDLTPLTDEQRDRASRAAHVPEIAAEQAANRRNDAFLDMMRGHAVDAYLYAARRFDPSRSHNGEAGWPAFAMKCVRMALWSRLKRVKAKTGMLISLASVNPLSRRAGPP